MLDSVVDSAITLTGDEWYHLLDLLSEYPKRIRTRPTNSDYAGKTVSHKLSQQLKYKYLVAIEWTGTNRWYARLTEHGYQVAQMCQRAEETYNE